MLFPSSHTVAVCSRMTDVEPNGAATHVAHRGGRRVRERRRTPDAVDNVPSADLSR